MVLIRIAGMFIFNPILGRSNIPTIAKMGVILFLTIPIAGTLYSITNIQVIGLLDLGFIAVFELAIGLIIGSVFRIFSGVFVVSGEIVDMQMGLGMAKVLDPVSNIQMPISGSIFNLIYMLFFFSTNAHLTLIDIIYTSFQMIPLGFTEINPEVWIYSAKLISQVMGLGLKLSLPIMAAIILNDLSIGILMKTVPQINVFVINIQFKIVFGLIMLYLTLVPISEFIDKILKIVFENVNLIIQRIA
ncbi:MAG: flagellar biosynthetic protein FliR [Oscillospiraceae bacterium]